MAGGVAKEPYRGNNGFDDFMEFCLVIVIGLVGFAAVIGIMCQICIWFGAGK